MAVIAASFNRELSFFNLRKGIVSAQQILPVPESFELFNRKKLGYFEKRLNM